MGHIRLLVGIQVRVNAQRGIHAVMTQPFGDQERREAHFNQHGCMAMPEVVETNTGHACALCGFDQIGGHVAGRAVEQHIAFRRTIHPLDVGLKLHAELIRDSDGTVAVLGLRGRDHVFAAPPVAGLGDGDRFLLEVDVPDRQRKALAAAHPGPEQRLIDRVQLRVGDGLDHLLILFQRPELHRFGIALADARLIAAGVAFKAVILFREIEDRGKVIVDRPQVGLAVFGLHHFGLPVVDHQRCDRADRQLAEGRQDLVAEDMLLLADRTVPQAGVAGLQVQLVQCLKRHIAAAAVLLDE